MSRKARRPSIHTLIAQVEKVGRPVKRVIFAPDGGFELILAEDEAPIANPWKDQAAE